MSGRRRPLRARGSATAVADHEDDQVHADQVHADQVHADQVQADDEAIDLRTADDEAADSRHGVADTDDAHHQAESAHEDHPVEGQEVAPHKRTRSRLGMSQRLRAMVDEQVSESRDESFHQAAMELQQFMEPARQQLVLNVPGSSSPEEAEAMLSRQAAIELDKPVTIAPESVIDLRNPPAMGAYPPAEKLSNRVLRLANRHWAKDKPRSSADIVAEKSAIADLDFAQKPAGTQRCFSQRGSIRCRGVFVFHSDQQEDGAPVACPTCGASHRWDAEEETWVVDNDTALVSGRRRGAIASSS